MRPGPQLLTYPDSLGGTLGHVADLLDGPLAGLFEGVHILPPFPSSADRGFAPLNYQEIDPRFGGWPDIERIAARHDVVLDLMINHISRQSPEFRDFERHGRRSRYADLFITIDKVWPNGVAPAEDVARLFLRKPDGPFSTITVADTGQREEIWTTFGRNGWAEQIDLDVRSGATRQLITGWLGGLADHGVSVVRLDAVGYVIKKPGTTSFMVEPEIDEFLDWVRGVAATYGLDVLPEVHDRWATHEHLASRGLLTYDFVLPGLVLHALTAADVRPLASHLARAHAGQVTNLDCHDGIPVRPDLDGILAPEAMRTLADRVARRGGNVNRILSAPDARADGVDVHQLNITYFSALDCDEQRYLTARAIQLFGPGVPQVYYVGLLAGENDHQAMEATGDGRAINRHDYSLGELEAALQRPVVRQLLDLIRLRRTHPAFGGQLEVAMPNDTSLRLAWRSGVREATLDVDAAAGHTEVRLDGVAAVEISTRLVS